ncbi:MAG: DinB family protein [Flavobacteriales bacterium]|nr:DinB family protein [Flavobacteriales bacterium]
MVSQWITQIDEISAQFRSEFGSLSTDQLNLKPGTDSWSIGEVIDHLDTVNRSYFPIFENLRTGRNKIPLVGKLSFYNRTIGKLILQSVLPDNERKSNTIGIWEPSDKWIDSSIIDLFEESQQLLKQWIDTLKNHIGKGVVISSPANRNITYELDTAIEIIIQHQYRHLNQAMNVKNGLILLQATA